MSLKATLRAAVKSAFKALDDVPQAVTYKSVSGAVVRDLDAGTSARTPSSYPLPMVVFAKFTEWQTDKDPALLTSMKMIFPTADLPVTPKVSDLIIDAAGTQWTFVKRLSDPASVVTILQVRTT